MKNKTAKTTVKLLLEHFIPSLMIGFILGGYFVRELSNEAFFREWKLSIIIALATGWMIDIDHLLDYLITWKKYSFSKEALQSVISGKYFLIDKKIYVIFHSWEWVFLWLVVWSLAGKLNVGIVGALSWTAHLLMDHLSYNLRWCSYFITYRLLNNFDLQIVCKNIEK